jgi:hypothetical protein
MVRRQRLALASVIYFIMGRSPTVIAPSPGTAALERELERLIEEWTR